MELVPSSRLSRKSVKVPPTSIPILYTGKAPLEDARFFELAIDLAEDIGHLSHGGVGLAAGNQRGHDVLARAGRLLQGRESRLHRARVSRAPEFPQVADLVLAPGLLVLVQLHLGLVPGGILVDAHLDEFPSLHIALELVGLS